MLRQQRTGCEEEDNDIKFTGNYAIRGWLQQPPPLIVHILLYRSIDSNNPKSVVRLNWV